MKRIVLLIAILFGSLLSVSAQEESNGFIVDLIQDSLSGPNRQIKLSGISGLLASDATVEEITVSDREGIWLTIKDAEIVWTRRALLSGRLKIDSLKAGEIDIARAPLPDTSLPSLEAEPFALPELPVSVELGALDIPRLVLGEALMGQSAILSLTGAISLIDGSLDTTLDIARTDVTGTTLALVAAYQKDGRTLDIDLDFHEDAGGLLTETLQMAGRPALDLKINGQGPLENIDIALDMAADGAEVLTGALKLREDEGGIGFEADIAGGLEPLIAPVYRGFFEGDTTILAKGRTREDGGFELDRATVETAVLTLDGSMATGADGFLRRADLEGTLGDGTAQTILPFGEGRASLRQADLSIAFGNDPNGFWKAEITGEDLIAGDVRSGAFELRFAGIAENIDDPETRNITINADGKLDQLRGATADMSRALGRSIGLKVASNWRPGTYRIDRARIQGNALFVELAGDIEDLTFEGDVNAKIDRLAPFGGLAGRDLQGAVDMTLKGIISPLAGSFDLALKGTSQALKLDIPALDPLLIGATDLSGQLLRNETGFRTRGFRLKNDQIRISSDGVVSSERADLTFEAVLADLADLTTRASGEVRLSGSAKGDDGRIGISTGIDIPQAELMNDTLRNFDARFDGVLQEAALTGAFRGEGALGSDPISLTADVTAASDQQTLHDLIFRIGSARFVGDLERINTGELSGVLSLTAPDVSPLAALALQEASGQANLTVRLLPNALGQRVVTTGQLSDIVLGTTEIGSAELDATIENAFGVPTIAGSLEFSDAIAGGIEIEDGFLTAGGVGNRTDIGLNTNLKNGTALSLSGALEATEAGYDVDLSRLNLSNDTPIMSLTSPAKLRVEGERIVIERLDLDLQDGEIQAQGIIAETFDVSLVLGRVPLGIANAFRDDLGLEGEITGLAAIHGPRDAPDFKFDLEALGLTATALRAAQMPPVNVTASGATEDGVMALKANLGGPGNFDADIQGDIVLDGLDMDLQGRLNRFPLALIDPVAGGQGLRGSVTGRFGVFDTPSKPRVNFDVDGQGISVNTTRANGIGALALSASGSFVNDVITLPAAEITDGNGLSFEISGRIPLRLDGLNVAANGQIPLAIVDIALARNGISATGVADVAIRATGSVSNPDLNGSLTLSNGTFVSTQANVRLEAVTLDASFAGDRLNLNSARAQDSRDGVVTASGFVVVDARRGFPVDAQVSVSGLRYTDGKLLTTEADGALTYTGALLRRSRLAGEITLSSLELSIPDTAGATDQYRLNVRHINQTPAVRRTLKRAGLDATGAPPPASDSIIDFDINVSAPNRVFVRGRGVDAELGGTLKVGGTSRNVQPVGRLELQRGRINVLAQRIDLTSGAVIFNGSIIPEIEMKARTVTDDVEANVSLEGKATNPELTLSSVPDLPDDEVLARLIFDRPLSELSPLQVAQLAATLGEISGRTGPSFFSQLRNATGLDDLDFETETDGRTTVRVGKYLQENLYSTLEADNRGSSRATINLDFNEKFKAKGTLDNDGNTSFGIFFETDY